MDDSATDLGAAGFGLMFYNARWYDPVTGRMAQADTIVPGGVQELDRYAYVNNSPVRYTDPTGHMCSDPEDPTPTCDGSNGIGSGEQTEEQKQNYVTAWYRNFLKERYDWNVAEDFTEEELRMIRQVAYDIETYVNGLTGGYGLEWMRYAFGNTTIEHVDFADGHSDTWPTFSGPRIRLNENWLNDAWGAKAVFAHELGHAWDINSGFKASGKMNRDLGGSGWCFFCSPGNGVPQWKSTYHRTSSGDAYGNSARNEYFAEAFAATIYNPTDAPTGVSQWIMFQVLIDVTQTLFPGGIQ